MRVDKLLWCLLLKIVLNLTQIQNVLNVKLDIIYMSKFVVNLEKY